ncbi:glycosyltransferase family 2 protein [Patescibacteria group bacterium]|nr:glycosyltransferase family 2 protein [Patescibacteria group bacterium]
MKKIKISVAMITYNEEGNIRDCLNSVQCADEIVVVDGSSRDKTRQIARELGARVIKTTNKLFFDANKNIAIEACQGEWILLLDADERVTPELAKEIRNTINNSSSSEQPVAYWLKRKNYFLGRYLQKGGQYPDPVIRLFKKGQARIPEESVHQQLEVDGGIGWLENDLLHWATPTFSRYWMRERRYSTLEALQMLDERLSLNPLNWLKYLYFRPKRTFFLIFIRCKGFVDGWPGFVFAFFSGFHHAWAFGKYLKMKITKKKIEMGEDW